MERQKPIGIILSEASTQEALCQFTEGYERGQIHEGVMLIVDLNQGKERILARVSEVIPFNAFYTSGDAWSEARRKNMAIPHDIARQFENAKLELLSMIPGGGAIRTPPSPGEFVYQIDISRDSEMIFGKKKGDPGIIWFGTLAGYKEAPVPLDIEYAPMHVAVFGTTGSGKSYDFGILLEKLSAIPSKRKENDFAYPVLIVDAHGDYVSYADYVAQGNSLGRFAWVKRFVFPEAITTNMALRSGKMKDVVFPLGIDLDQLSDREIAETIILFYKGTLEGTDLSVRALEEGFNEMRAQGHLSMHMVLKDPTFRTQMKAAIQRLPVQVVHGGSASAAIRALDEFVGNVQDVHRLLSPSPISSPKLDFVSDITGNHGLAIVDFSAEGAPGVDLRVKQLVVTYLASILMKRFTEFKMKGDTRYLIFAIEEAHNFAPNHNYPISTSLAKRKLSDISTQGRKFGLSLCIISQSPRFVDQIVVSMCNTFILHKVSHEDIGFVRNVTGGLPSSLQGKLTTLDQGEIIMTGQMNPVAFPLIAKLTDKRLVEHRTGRTNVVEGLSGSQ